MIYNGSIEFSTDAGTLAIENVAGLTAEVFESIYGPSICKLNFDSANTNFWNSLIEDEGQSRLKFRVIGLSDSASGEEEPVWKTAYVKNFKCVVTGKLAHVEVLGYDYIFMLQHSCRRASYIQKTVSEIVQEITDANLIKAEIDKVSKAKYNLYQCGMSDYDFIRDVLIPRASKDNVLFYMKNGDTLVFKLRKKEKPKLQFSYGATGGDGAIRLDSFTATYSICTSNFYLDGVTFDKAKSQEEPYLWESSSSNLPADPLSGHLAALFTATLTTSKTPSSYGKITNFVTDISEKNIQEALTMRLRPLVPSTMHRVAVSCILLPQVEIGSTANIDTETTDGKKLSFGGSYLIYALYHRIFPGGDMGTRVFLERRGVAASGGK